MVTSGQVIHPLASQGQQEAKLLPCTKQEHVCGQIEVRLGTDKQNTWVKQALMHSLWFILRYNLLPRIIEAKYLDAMDAEH